MLNEVFEVWIVPLQLVRDARAEARDWLKICGLGWSASRVRKEQRSGQKEKKLGCVLEEVSKLGYARRRNLTVGRI